MTRQINSALEAQAGSPEPIVASASPELRPKLAKLGIATDWDLILHLPLRYEDETRLTPIARAAFGETVQVEGEIVNAHVQYRPRRQLVLRVADTSGSLHVRYLHFYPSQSKQLQLGRRVRLLGEIRPGFSGPEMVHPKSRIVDDRTPLEAALTPVYPSTAGLAQSALRRLIERALTRCDLSESLPESMRAALHVPEFRACILTLHQPAPDADRQALGSRTHPAWRRIKFDELLAQQIALRLMYRQRRSRKAPRLLARDRLTRGLISALPFTLTKAQQRAWAEISRDLQEPRPMQRLLQGDVGSGKTIVAALAAAQAVENGYQVALMAPTEILAEQHYDKLRAHFDRLAVSTAWLGGTMKKKEREAALSRISAGGIAVAIGTHALIQEQVEFRNLGLAIVDEQHRFGVQQRLALRHKGFEPHQLTMSATPIPRTLAMSYCADLDVSVIDELPPGRTPVATKLISESRRAEVIARVREACLAGRQAYWVCPLIEESEALELKTALETYNTVRQAFPDLSVGLVHGRLSGAEKANVMEAFARGEIQLLVATTVIEVGVDVPNASIIVIEHAERMGLAQLHQLRGRVGRGADQSTCILLYAHPLSELARARLRIIFETTDGFEIARADLKLRGPGEFLGARQSGAPLLRFADIEQDADLIEAARQSAERLLAEHPEAAASYLARWLGHKQSYLEV